MTTAAFDGLLTGGVAGGVGGPAGGVPGGGAEDLSTVLWLLVAEAGHHRCPGWTFEERDRLLVCACGRRLYELRLIDPPGRFGVEAIPPDTSARDSTPPDTGGCGEPR